MSKKDSLLRYILIVSLIYCGCKEKHSQPLSETSSAANCYIIKPVKGDSKADSLRSFDFHNDSIGDFLNNGLFSSKEFLYDSTMDFVTSFERQKLIFVQSGCFEKLNKPDSCNLMNIYYNSGYNTKIMTKTIIEFVQSYKKNIYEFGKSIVYEYRFVGVAEIEPHFMFIIMKEQADDEQRMAKDYKGVVLCSDGLEWKEFNEKEFSIPLFVQMVRRDKELYIPLDYDGHRFIPIGHFRKGKWDE